MSNLHRVEEKEANLPLLCVYGDEEFLLQHLIQQNFKKFRIIVVSARKPKFLDELSDIYFLTYQDATLLPKLEETIDYGLVLISDEKAATFLQPAMSKFSTDGTSVLFVVDVFCLVKNLEIIREYKTFPNIKFALLGEILSKRTSDQKGQLSKIIDNILSKHEIDLHGDNLSSVYPISINDAMVGISRLLFGNYKSDNVHLLFYKHPETILSTAHAIARIDPDIKINFSDEKNSALTISRDEIRTILETRLRMDQSYMDSALNGFEKAIQPILEGKETVQDSSITHSVSTKTKK